MKFLRDILKDITREVLDEGKFTIEHPVDSGVEFTVRPVGHDVSIPHADGPDITFHVDRNEKWEDKR